MVPYNKESREQAHAFRDLLLTEKKKKNLPPIKTSFDQEALDGMDEISLIDQPTDGSVVSTQSSTSEGFSSAYGQRLPSLDSASSIPSSPSSLNSFGSSPRSMQSSSSRSLFSPNSEVDFFRRSASSEPCQDRVQTAVLQRSSSLSTSPRPRLDLKETQEKCKRNRRQRDFNPFEKPVKASPRPKERTDKETVLTLNGQRVSMFRQQVQAWSDGGAEKEDTNAQSSVSFPAISNTQGS